MGLNLFKLEEEINICNEIVDSYELVLAQNKKDCDYNELLSTTATLNYYYGRRSGLLLNRDIYLSYDEFLSVDCTVKDLLKDSYIEYGIKDYKVKIRRGHLVECEKPLGEIDNEFQYMHCIVKYFFYDPHNKTLEIFI